jgi:hypothetical protein
MSSNDEILLLSPSASGGCTCLIPADEFWERFEIVTLDTAEGSDSDDWTFATVKPKSQVFANEWSLEKYLAGYTIGHGRSCIETGERETRLLGIYYLIEE